METYSRIYSCFGNESFAAACTGSCLPPICTLLVYRRSCATFLWRIWLKEELFSLLSVAELECCELNSPARSSSFSVMKANGLNSKFALWLLISSRYLGISECLSIPRSKETISPYKSVKKVLIVSSSVSGFKPPTKILEFFDAPLGSMRFPSYRW